MTARFVVINFVNVRCNRSSRCLLELFYFILSALSAFSVALFSLFFVGFLLAVDFSAVFYDLLAVSLAIFFSTSASSLVFFYRPSLLFYQLSLLLSVIIVFLWAVVLAVGRL